jgi:hypothetical protein
MKEFSLCTNHSAIQVHLFWMTGICKYETIYYLSILCQLQYFLGSYTESTFLIEFHTFLTYLSVMNTFFCYSIDSSHIKRTLTLPIEKEQTEIDTAHSPTNDPKRQKKR